jgi:Ni,Fe-hydrogenase I small subunit
MRITRREFLKYCSVAAGALGLTSTDLLKLDQAFAKEGTTSVIWIQGASCTGDSTSLLNTIFYTDPVGLLVTDGLDLNFHQTVQNASGTDLLGATDVLAVAQTYLPGGASTTYAEWSSDTWSDGNESIKLRVGDRSNNALEAYAEITPEGLVLINEFNMTFRFKTGENQAPFVELDVVNQDTSATATLSSHYPAVTGDQWLTPADGGIFGPTDWQTIRLSDYTLWKAAGGPPDQLPDTNLTPGDELGAYTNWAGVRDTYGTWIVTKVRVIDQGNNAVYAPVTDSCTMYIDGIVIAGVFYEDRSPFITLFPSPTGTGGAYVLVVEGSVVTGTPPGGTLAGEYCEVGPMVAPGDPDETMLHAFLTYARSAAAIIAAGTCASFGGIPKLGQTGAKGVKEVLKANGIKTPVINVPGCPAHPDWIVGTIAAFLARGLDGIALDSQLRPYDFYGGYVCSGNQGATTFDNTVDVACPWRYNNDGFNNTTGLRGEDNVADDGNFPIGESRGLAKYKWGSIPAGMTETYDDETTGPVTYNAGHTFEGCLGALGCRGRKTHADCAYRKWNAATTLTPGTLGVNWCVGSRGGCQGCTEPTFPSLKRFYTFV